MRREWLAIVAILACRYAFAATLEVGPAKAFARPEQAVEAAKSGDVIVVFPSADGRPYEHVAIRIKTPGITLRAADVKDAVVFDGAGFDYSGSGPTSRAIVQFDLKADGGVLEGFDLRGARNKSYNGAGVRIDRANGVVIRDCKIHDNDMGIMSNGSLADRTASDQLIEGCLITDNGSSKYPGYSHNLYLGGTSVTVRGCEIARAVVGNNLKSRAHLTWIEYNYIHDSANREVDLVDEKGNTDAPHSDAVLLGNWIVKSRKMSGNRNVIHFGQDSGKCDHTGTLYLVHNTIDTFYRMPVVDLSAPGKNALFFNNLISAEGVQRGAVLLHADHGASLQHVVGEGNEISSDYGMSDRAGVKDGPIVPWKDIDLPWAQDARFAQDRTALQRFGGIGKIEPRDHISAAAGAE